MSVFVWVIGGFIVLVALSRAFYRRPRDRRFKSGIKWNEAAMPIKHRLLWLIAAFAVVVVLLAVHDAGLR